MRWRLYDGDTRELLDFGADDHDMPKAIMALMDRNLVVVQHEEEDDGVPWGEVQPKNVLLIDAEHTGAVNWLFLGLTNLADDMGKAEDPFTERLDDLTNRFFTAVTTTEED